MPESVIDKLVTLLVYRNDPGNNAARQKFEQGLRSTANAARGMAVVLRQATVVVGGLAAGLGAAVQQTANATDRVNKFAEAQGVAFGKLKEFEFAAGINGATYEQLARSIEGVNERLGEFRRGAGDQAVLAELGVDIGEGDALDFLENFADQEKELETPAAQDLAKKLGIDPQVVLLLKQGSDGIAALRDEARSFGFATQESRSQAAEFLDSQLRLSTILSTVKNTVVLSITPAFTDAANAMSRWVTENNELIKSSLTDVLSLVLSLTKGLAQAGLALASAFQFLSDVLGGADQALKAITFAFIALKLSGSATFLALASGAFSTIRALAALDIAVLKTNAKILLIPVLIIAAIVAALLVLEDLYTFINGGESVIGDAVDYWGRFADQLLETSKTARVVRDIFQGIATAVNGTGEFLGNTAGRAVALTQGGAQRDFAVNEIADTAGNTLSNAAGVAKVIGSDLFDFGAGKLNDLANFGANFFGQGGGSTDNSTTTSSQALTQNIEVNIETTGGTLPNQVDQAVGSIRQAVSTANPLQGGQ